MADVVAEAEAGLVITHNRSATEAELDILGDMRRFFDRSLDLGARAGIPMARILLDPGLGFHKTSRQNLAAMRFLPSPCDYGLPILVGASCKRFLGSLGDGGEAIFRVHDVAWHRAALRVAAAIRQPGAGGRGRCTTSV